MPSINNSNDLKIIEGRHPVIESQLTLENPYIPNDILLNNIKDQILIITGPNMSGKSAILRQTALIVLFIPFAAILVLMQNQMILIVLLHMLHL